MNGARNPFFTSRGYRRYDPQTRKYRDWFVPEDWAGMGVDGYGIGPNGLGYPRFTNHDAKKMLRGYAQRRRVDPTSMGKEWHHDGPRVGVFVVK
jgi:hypothetical protein